LMQRRLMLDAGGSAVRHLYITKVAQTRFALPPRVQQEEIVDVLRRTETAIRSTQERESDCVRMAQKFLDAAMRGE